MRTLSTIFAVALFLGMNMSAIAQCDTLRHNNTWFDSWISCEETASPNPARDSGHWILYDYGQQYSLYELRIWNINAPDILDYGMQNVIIDISSDGINWTEHGQYVVPQASGSPRYEGTDVMTFDSTNAQYVLITAVDNYGGSCYGLSEVRVRARDRCPEDKVEWIAGNGNWDVPSNWCNNKIPDQFDDVIIPSGVVVTIPFLYTAHVHKLTADPGSELRMIGNLVVHSQE